MRINLFLMAILCLFVGGCGAEQQTPPPDKLLNYQQMSAIMTEIHMAEAAISLSNVNQLKALRRFNKYESDILKKHGVDTALYYRSYNYYMQHPKKMDIIYSAVLDSLLLREAAAKKRYIRSDSVNTIPVSSDTLTTQPNNQSTQ